MTVPISTIAQQALRRLGVRIVPIDDSPVLMETVPAATIANNALVELGVISAEETGTAADQALVLDKVKSVHGALDAQGVVWWTSDAIPRAFAEEYTKLTALNSASSFGKQADPQLVRLLEDRVRKGVMVLSADDNAQQAAMSVHQDLVMRGLARWTVFDIPDALGDPYVVLTADALAPLFSTDTDPRDTQDALTAIYRYIALPSSGEVVRAAYF